LRAIISEALEVSTRRPKQKVEKQTEPEAETEEVASI
jgi:hypothetical protein